MGVVVTILSAFGSVAKALGFAGTLWAVAGLALLGLTFKFMELADRLLDRLSKRWRKLPPWMRHTLLLLALVLFGPSVWKVAPKGVGGVALVAGVLAAFCVGGASYAKKYSLDGVTFSEAWKHHLEVSRAARKHTAAIPDGTGKKGGRARKPTPTPDGADFIVHPPHGMSDVETADTYNDGKMNSALADRLGLDAVQDVTATPVGDGTVKVSVLHAQTKDDFFDASHAWPGMEKP